MADSRSRRPLIIAHRGASGYLPEHSFAAKALAYGQGADFLEQDVVSTRDGVPIVFHDLTLDALTDVAERFPGRARPDGSHYCIDFDLAELRQLRVHERIDPATGTARYPGRFPPESGGFPIQTLREELALVRGLNRASGREVGIYPEIKAPEWHRSAGIGLTSLVLAELSDAGFLAPGQPVFLQCFDATTLQDVAADPRAEHLALIQLVGRANAALLQDLASIAAYATGIGPSISLFKPAFPEHRDARVGTDWAAAAQEAGLAVHPYTFRADELPPGCQGLDELLALFVDQLGVDGLFTDFPDQVRRYLGGA